MYFSRWFRTWRTAILFAGTLLLLPSCRRDDPTGPGPNPSNYPIVSSFDDGDSEGWTLIGDSDLVHRPAGGNPGGYAFGIDRVEGPVSYWRAPEKFLLDVSGAYGRLLTFDLVWSENSPSRLWPDDEHAGDVILRGAGITLTHPYPEIPETRWTSYAIRLDESGNWRNEQTGAPATADDIQAVLGNLGEFRIRGEFREGPEDFGLDNVRFGVAP